METLAAIFLFLSTAIATSLVTNSQFSLFGGDMVWSHSAYTAARLSPLPFVVAAILVYFKPRRGYLVALVTGLLALPWFALTELSGSGNSWTALNYYDFGPAEGSYLLTQATLKILATLVVVTAVALSVLRLTSSPWRTWPALAVSAFVLAAWFVYSVIPYSIPSYEDHRADAQLRILHVQKRGLWFQETRVMGFRYSMLYSTHHTRRLFEYRFTGRASRTEMPHTALGHMRDLVRASRLWNPHTPAPKPLRSWNAEGWYVVVEDTRLFTFSTEYGTTPPEEVLSLFHELESVPALEERPITERDVCLGFCYDPLAGLGFSIRRQRVRLLNHQP